MTDVENNSSKNQEGLLGQDHAYLNSLVSLTDRERLKRLSETRAKYQGKPHALAQIDKYDWKSPFSIRLQEVIDAGNTGDFAKAKKLSEKLKIDFPDHT